MKLNKLLVALPFILATGIAHAEDPSPTPNPVFANGGTIHFTGEMVNAACAVSTQSANQTVELGQYRTGSFSRVGDTSAKIPFTIVLNDCDSEVATNVAVAFSGQTDATNADLLAVASSDNTPTAGNVGIEILDNASVALSPNGAEFSTAQALVDGTNTIHFSARYKSTAATVTPGQANADATFVVKYE